MSAYRSPQQSAVLWSRCGNEGRTHRSLDGKCGSRPRLHSLTLCARAHNTTMPLRSPEANAEADLCSASRMTAEPSQIPKAALRNRWTQTRHNQRVGREEERRASSSTKITTQLYDPCFIVFVSFCKCVLPFKFGLKQG